MVQNNEKAKQYLWLLVTLPSISQNRVIQISNKANAMHFNDRNTGILQ